MRVPYSVAASLELAPQLAAGRSLGHSTTGHTSAGHSMLGHGFSGRSTTGRSHP